MKDRVICFGELMLRLAPEGYYRFVQADRYGATFGGGEANVAVSLANFGIDAAFVTKLPEHEIGTAALGSLRRFGVDCDHIVRGGSWMVKKDMISSKDFDTIEKLAAQAVRTIR